MWEIAAGAALGGLLGGGGGSAAPVYQEDPRITQARLDQMAQDRVMQSELQAWSAQDRADLRPALIRSAQTSADMQGLAADEARRTIDYKRSRYDPAREQFYDEAFRPDADLRAARERASGDAMAGVQQQMDSQQAMAMRRAAAYGYNPMAGTNINQTVGAAAAKAGAANTERRREDANQRQQKTAAMGLFSDNPMQNLAGTSQMASATGGLTSGPTVGGNAAGLSSQFSTLPAINSASQAGQFGHTSAMSAWQTEQNQPSPWGQIAQLGTTYLGMQNKKADGGRINYADGGEVDTDPFPGLTEPMGYADGGMPALERYDGEVTQGDGSGGMLYGPGDGISDDIPAETEDGEELRVANGEYVIPADVVEILGEDFFDNLIARLHTPAAIQREQQEVA